MKREYIITYEVWKDGEPSKWAEQTLTVEGDETPNAKEFSDQYRNSAAEHHGCKPSAIRTIGIWRL